MVRFYIPSTSINGAKLEIDGEPFHYLNDVLRVKKGENVIAFDGTGKEYVCTIDKIHSRCMNLNVTRTFTSQAEPLVEIHLVQSLIKKGHFEFVIQKCTEVGVKKFIPAVTERTVVKLEEGREENRRLRWKKLAMEAARQCGRGIYPDVGTVMEFKDVLKDVKGYDISIIPWEEEKALTLKQALKELKVNPGKVMVFIGPEGGFTKREISSAKKCGVIPVSLGPRLMRSETAAIAATAILIYQLENNVSEANPPTPFTKGGFGLHGTD